MKWPSVDFSTLFSLPLRNGLWKEADYQNPVGIAVLKMKQLFGLSILREIPHGSDRFTLSNDEQQKFSVLEGDLLFSRTSVVPEGVGRCSIVLYTENCCFESNLIRVRIDKQKANSLFYYYYFQSHLGRSSVLSLSSGTSVKTIKGSTLSLIKVPAPPLFTQNMIADILGAYDNLINSNQRRIKLLEEAARCRYKILLDEQKEKLSSCSVFEYAYVLSGGTPKTAVQKYWNGDIPFFTPKDLTTDSGYYLDDTERMITPDGLASCNSALFPRDTVFITARGTVGKLVLARVPSAMSQSNYALKSRDGSSQLFLFLALSDRISHFKQVAVGGVFDTIVVDTFKQIMIEYPSKSSLDTFETSVRPLFRKIEVLQSQNALLLEARDILLPRLMNGEIDVSSVTINEPEAMEIL